MKEHTSQSVELYSSLTWTLPPRKLKREPCCFVHVLKMPCSSKWGCSVSSLLSLPNSWFEGLLQCSLPAHKHVVLHLKYLEFVHTRSFRLWCTSSAGALAETHAIIPFVIRTQKTFPLRLRHRYRNGNLHIRSFLQPAVLLRLSDLSWKTSFYFV